MNDFNTLGADVVAISLDSPENNLKAVEKLKLTFPLLADPEGAVVDHFGMRHENGMGERDVARPGVFVLDENRKVVWRSLTDNYRMRVRPAEIINALGELSQ